MRHPLELELQKTFAQDQTYLEHSFIPIITVSASYKEDLKKLHGLPDNEFIPDVVFSRAHFSMALAAAVTAWGEDIDPQKAWIVDPTNYVSHHDWRSVQLTEFIGKTIARQPLLKTFKDLIDRFGRSKLPILESISPPLLQITKNIKCPILSFHIAAGNILVEQGKNVIQIITDPHVRDEYTTYADRPNLWFCVFDEQTKTDLVEIVALNHKKIDPDHIFVTGPSVDPRIIKGRQHKHAWRNGPLKLCITTGGLGTNKEEIRQLLEQLLPELRKHQDKFRLLIYTGTQKDIYHMVKKIAKQEHIAIDKMSDRQANFRLLYHPQIVEANELLIKYAFPWADGFMTKPSGDMAYDAVAAGCFLLTLKEWGVWEHHIFERFAQKSIARAAITEHILDQLTALTDARQKSHSWVEEAMNNALNIDKIYLEGTKNILDNFRVICKKFT